MSLYMFAEFTPVVVMPVVGEWLRPVNLGDFGIGPDHSPLNPIRPEC
jgi:hypothetical protein